MWLEDAPASAEGEDDLLVVIEEALALLLRLPRNKARSAARSLAAVANNPPQVSADVGRTDAIRISVRAILRGLQGEAQNS